MNIIIWEFERTWRGFNYADNKIFYFVYFFVYFCELKKFVNFLDSIDFYFLIQGISSCDSKLCDFEYIGHEVGKPDSSSKIKREKVLCKEVDDEEIDTSLRVGYFDENKYSHDKSDEYEEIEEDRCTSTKKIMCFYSKLFRIL